jgi:hypothetical protein
MSKEYEVVKTVQYTFIVNAENEEEALKDAWAHDDSAPMLDYDVYDIEITCLEDEEE